MTTEEKEKAIRWLTEEVRSLRLAPTVNGCKPDNWEEQLEIMETCLEAVRGCNQVAIELQPGFKKLTLEQLRKMYGNPVFVDLIDKTAFMSHVKGGWTICNPELLFFMYVERNYGQSWVCYAYHPAHIDMEAWVSVEEKLPDAEEEVRLCCMTASGYRYQCQGFYVPPGTHRDDSGYSWDWECFEEYDEERDDYLVNPGWYESIHNWDEYSACGIVDRVIYWMPLPETPGELEKRIGDAVNA